MPGHVPHAEQVCALALLRRKRRPLRSLGVVDASVHLDAARDGVKDGDGELGEHRVGAADDVEEEVGKGLQVLAHLRLGPLRVRPQHGRLDDALKVERRLADQRRGRLALVAEKGARQAEVEALVVDDLAALVAVGGAQVSRAQAERVQGELQPAPCALQVGSSPLEPRLDDRAVLFKLRVQPRARESRPRLASREGSLPAAASAARACSAASAFARFSAASASSFRLRCSSRSAARSSLARCRRGSFPCASSTALISRRISLRLSRST
mmetsp:Transcript_49280/g.159736  ORF Transcript_49280/g.159736 Transcript_49280/m.159736 type:complete len:269 (-) Transcript_49280:471-1277(-)